MNVFDIASETKIASTNIGTEQIFACKFNPVDGTIWTAGVKTVKACCCCSAFSVYVSQALIVAVRIGVYPERLVAQHAQGRLWSQGHHADPDVDLLLAQRTPLLLQSQKITSLTLYCSFVCCRVYV